MSDSIKAMINALINGEEDKAAESLHSHLKGVMQSKVTEGVQLDEGKKPTAAQLKASVASWIGTKESLVALGKPAIVVSGDKHRSKFKKVDPKVAGAIYKELKADGFKSSNIPDEKGVLHNKAENITVLFDVQKADGSYVSGASASDFNNKSVEKIGISVQLFKNELLDSE